jgi:hypothetical protein
MRPLLTTFLNAIGLERTQTSVKGSENQQYVRMKGDKQPSTVITDHESHPGNDASHTWSSSTSHDPKDEIPLHSIHVQKDYEQRVEGRNTELDEQAASRKKNHFPS